MREIERPGKDRADLRQAKVERAGTAFDSSWGARDPVAQLAVRVS